jgi:DNA primase
MTVEMDLAPLLAANEDAANYYRRRLLGPEGHGPREYLRGRGFEALLGDTAWTVGYAPGSWNAGHDYLSALGYTDDVLLTAGLVSRTRKGTLIDRFRDRITFGVRDEQLKLRGFTARRAPGTSEACPKYLNTPATAAYNKSEQLFGLGEAPQLSAHATTAVVTEGPLDAIAIASATSSTHARVRSLAVCGTAMSTAQARLVTSGAVDTVVLAFDSDAAGRLATLNGFTALSSTSTSTSVRIARFPLGDPAEVAALVGTRGIEQLLGGSTPGLETVINDLVDSWPARGRGAEADLCCLRHIAARLVTVEGLDAAEAARHLGSRLHFSIDTVSRELSEAITNGARASQDPRPANRRNFQVEHASLPATWR